MTGASTVADPEDIEGETRLLGDVVEFLDSQRRPVTEGERAPGPFPYFGANGQLGTIDDYIFDEDLVLLAEDGGHFSNPERGIAYRISGKTWVNNHAHVLRPTSMIHIGYLCRVLENYDVMRFVTGSTRPKLTKARASKIPIPLPPLPEQRRIASVLDGAGALQARRQAAFEQLDVLTQSIFLEMFGDPVTNLKAWPLVTLGEHASKIGSGATPRGGQAAYKTSGISLIRSMNVRDGTFLRTALAFIDNEQARKLDNVIVEEGDILLNITGASVARVCRAPADVLPARVNQHVAIIRTTDALSTLFLEQLLLSAPTKEKLLRLAGAGATREAITKSQIAGLEVICPPPRFQEEFGRRVAAITKLEAANRMALSELDGLFRSLQQQAFRGEL